MKAVGVRRWGWAVSALVAAGCGAPDDYGDPDISVPVLWEVSTALDPEKDGDVVTSFRNVGVEVLTWSMQDVPEDARAWLTPTTTSGELSVGEVQNLRLKLMCPDTVGDFATQLTFDSNDPDTPQVVLDVKLRCQGPVIDVAPAAIELEGLIPDQVTSLLTIANLGEKKLTYKVSASDSWLGLGSKGASVAAGASDNLQVYAFCETEGTQSTSLVFESDDPVQPTVTVPVSLSCAYPPAPDVEVDEPWRLDGEAEVERLTEAAASFSNEGEKPLNWSIEIDEDDRDWIVAIAPNSGTLDPGEAEELVATLQCGFTREVLRATLVLASNDPADPEIDLPVELSCLAPVVGVDPTSVALAALVGEEASDTVRITNDGDLDLDLELSARDDWLVLSEDAATLEPGDDLDLSLSALCEEAGTFDTTVDVESNDPDSPRVEVEVILTCTEPYKPSPELTLGTPASVSLSGQGAGLTGEFSFSNDGDASLDWALTLPSSAEAPWLIGVTPRSGRLPAGGQQTVEVEAECPPGPGTYQSNLALTSNDEDEGEVAVPVSLTCEGGVLRVEVIDADVISVDGEDIAGALVVYNDGDAPMDFTVRSDDAMIDVSPTSGTLPGGGDVDVAFAVDCLERGAGVYEGTLTVTPDDFAEGDPAEIPVTYECVFSE